jgi:hypothetical protein
MSSAEEEHEPTVGELAERLDALEKSVSKLRGLVFAFKPKAPKKDA